MVCAIGVCNSSYSNNNFQAQASERIEYDDRCQRILDKAPQAQIVITKLNPEVQEFVPKNIQSTDNVPRNLSHDCNTLEELTNVKHSSELLEKVPKLSKGNDTCPKSMKEKLGQKSCEAPLKIDRNGAGDCDWVICKDPKGKQFVMPDKTKALDSDLQMYSKVDDKKKMTAMLKEQISKIPKDSSFDKRKDRNVAIAALIKVNTIASPVSNSTSNSPSPQPVLLTPDFFKGPSNSENLDAQDRENLAHSSRVSTSKLLEEDNTKNIENVEKNILEENITPNKEAVRTPIDPYMQESINKVNNWFNGAPRSKPVKQYQSTKPDISKPKSAEPYLGTIMFKKKSVPERNSPLSDISIPKSPVRATPAYVPTKRAQDLVKKYESNQVKEEYIDIWTKLERDLKIKDEEYKLRIRQREAQNDINNATSSTL